MSFMNRSPQRVWNFHPASFKFRIALARLRKLTRGGPNLVKMLLVSNGAGYTNEQQFAPIGRHADLLRNRLGIVAQYRTLTDVLRMTARELAQFEIIGLKFGYQTLGIEVERIVQFFANAVAGAATKLVYFDGDDDSNVQWHAAIAKVDLYVKKHIFADAEDYSKMYLGKSNLTDYVARNHGVSFADNIIPTSGGLSPANLSKLHLGWNIGLDDKIFELAQQARSRPPIARDIDISCRAYVKPEVWTHALRNSAVESMEKLSGRARILAPRDRVTQEMYYEEMLRSKIVVSPYGYGELCWRDFEAILCGCLLVKPDMDHLKTAPDLFVPNVTYVPVRWDYSDLESQCARYLSNEGERVRVVERARATLLEALKPEFFLNSFSALLERLKLGGERERSLPADQRSFVG